MHDNPQFRKGIEEFNSGNYFECHDTLEELWMDTSGTKKLFLQGLIQIAVGFYHFLNGNYKGATSQLTKGLNKLERYRPSFQGIDLELFIMQVLPWLALAGRGVRGEVPDIDDTTIPKLPLSRYTL